MKFMKLIAAGLAFATLSVGAVAPAEAQRSDRRYSEARRDNDRRDFRNDRRDDRRFRHNRHDRRDDRRFRGNRRNDRGYSQRCRFENRRGQRIQVCR